MSSSENLKLPKDFIRSFEDFYIEVPKTMGTGSCWAEVEIGKRLSENRCKGLRRVWIDSREAVDSESESCSPSQDTRDREFGMEEFFFDM